MGMVLTAAALEEVKRQLAALMSRARALEAYLAGQPSLGLDDDREVTGQNAPAQPAVHERVGEPAQTDEQTEFVAQCVCLLGRGWTWHDIHAAVTLATEPWQGLKPPTLRGLKGAIRMLDESFTYGWDAKRGAWAPRLSDRKVEVLVGILRRFTGGNGNGESREHE